MGINIRKLATLAMASSAMLALSGLGGVQAREAQAIPGTFASAIVVSNPGTTTANVNMQFVKADGTAALPSAVTFQVAPGSSTTRYVPNEVGLADGRYSVVLDSDQDITAVANLDSLNPMLKTSYNGISQRDVGTTFNVPQAFRNYAGYTSAIVVQNAGTSTANVTVRYNAGGNQVATETTTIPANASKTIDQATTAGLPEGFNGSAVVTSDQPVAAIFLVSGGGQLSSGRGARTGATVVNVPALYNYYVGQFVSSMVVQNVDTTSTNVEVKYYSGGTNVATQLATIASGSSALFLQFGDQSAVPVGFIGSAVVRSLDGKNIVAVANIRQVQQNYLETYSGFPTTAATRTASCPSIMNNYYGFYTALTIQNVGSSATDVTITYKNPNGQTVDQKTVNIAAGGVHVRYNPTQDNLPAGATVYSATIQAATGGQIVALVSQQAGQGEQSGDVLLTYACANS